jgi:hypothetical protein
LKELRVGLAETGNAFVFLSFQRKNTRPLAGNPPHVITKSEESS